MFASIAEARTSHPTPRLDGTKKSKSGKLPIYLMNAHVMNALRICHTQRSERYVKHHLQSIQPDPWQVVHQPQDHQDPGRLSALCSITVFRELGNHRNQSGQRITTTKLPPACELPRARGATKGDAPMLQARLTAIYLSLIPLATFAALLAVGR